MNGQKERGGDSPRRRRAFPARARHTCEAQHHAASTHSCCSCSCTRSSTITSPRMQKRSRAAAICNLLCPLQHTQQLAQHSQLAYSPAACPRCEGSMHSTHAHAPTAIYGQESCSISMQTRSTTTLQLTPFTSTLHAHERFGAASHPPPLRVFALQPPDGAWGYIWAFPIRKTPHIY